MDEQPVEENSDWLWNELQVHASGLVAVSREDVHHRIFMHTDTDACADWCCQTNNCDGIDIGRRRRALDQYWKKCCRTSDSPGSGFGKAL